MENKSSPEALHGMFIAQASLMNSLIRVLPLEALQALLPELERDAEFGQDFLVAQPLSERSLAEFHAQTQSNLRLVRDQIQQKEAMHTPDGALHWLLRRSPNAD